jgi:tRNA(Arg) A34 adenosine deaminase TadA
MIDDQDRKYLKYAVELGKQGIRNGIGGPFGAVIVKDGEIIGEGCNRVLSTNDPTAHAEVVAIRDACKNIDNFQLTGSTIYSSCEPCPMCLGAIYWARPERLVFSSSKDDAADAGFDDAFIYKEMTLNYKDRSIKTDSEAIPEGSELFEEWKNNFKDIEY